MSKNQPNTRPRSSGLYEVHWLLTVTGGKAKVYGQTIRQGWLTHAGFSGKRRLTCDYAAGIVIVVVQVAADDFSQAIAHTMALVIEPIQRDSLPLPEDVAVLVAPSWR